MNIGIVCSSGGSVFKEAFSIIRNVRGDEHKFYAITDRQCGFEEICKVENIPCVRIDAVDNREFSLLAREELLQFGKIDVVQLFFHRLVTEELFSFFPTVNIHPALLPAFKGLRAVGQAFDAKAKFLGATLHQVDANMDSGVIIGQTVMPILPSYTKELLGKFSFIQKTFLFLLLVDLLESKSLRFEQETLTIRINEDIPYSGQCNPAIRNTDYMNGLFDLQKREGVEVIKV